MDQGRTLALEQAGQALDRQKERNNTLSQKSDAQITQDVLDEISWDPAVTVADLSVNTTDQRVTLMGTTTTYGEKLEAEEAAYRVAGVRYVENAIAVDPSAFGMLHDQDIAYDVRSALILDYKVPNGRINVSVFDGAVTLTGTVDWYYQSQAAADDAAKIMGVKSVENDIVVMPPEASATDISDGIARAFARNAELFDDNVRVSTDGGHVTLSGNVETWGEYKMAEDVARRSPGVSSVTNTILVLAE
jgi:osmotically-inducible protein OsmY